MEKGTVNSYVVPMYALLGLCVNTNDASTLNETVKNLMMKVQESKEIKTILGETSQRLTEEINKIEEGIVAMLVPGAFFPVKEQQESEIVVDFIEKVNEMIHEEMSKKENG